MLDISSKNSKIPAGHYQFSENRYIGRVLKFLHEVLAHYYDLPTNKHDSDSSIQCSGEIYFMYFIYFGEILEVLYSLIDTVLIF